MVYLILCILSSSSIAVIFKIRDRLQIPLLPIIVLNYLAATILGFSLIEIELSVEEISRSDWIYSGLFVGILLIVGFWLIGYSTEKVGLAITTVSSKMSVAIPIIFSILYFGEDTDLIKIFGIVAALISIVLTVFKKNNKNTDLRMIWLPVFLFAAIGVIDSLVKYSQEYLSDDEIPVFTMLTFGIAFISGIFIALLKKSKFSDYIKPKVLITGTILGLANFGSMYFLILALEKSNLDSSVVFGINNVSIISLSAFLAYILFNEKLRAINWIGIFLSLIAVLLLSNIL